MTDDFSGFTSRIGKAAMLANAFKFGVDSAFGQALAFGIMLEAKGHRDVIYLTDGVNIAVTVEEDCSFTPFAPSTTTIN